MAYTGTRFAQVRHTLGHPVHLIIMVAVMLVVIAAALTVLSRFAL